jgi:hypothetical protein
MAVIPCTSTPPVFGIVTFDPAAFVVLYPEFTGLTNGQMNQAFALATTILNNTCSSRVCDANLRDTLLQMLTAHICFLLYGSNDGGTTMPLFVGVGSINGITLSVTSTTSGALAPGYVLTGTGVLPGTVIQSAGGPGQYTVTVNYSSPVTVPNLVVLGAPQIVPPPGIVGRINTASEGTVSVGAEFGGNGGPTQDWYTSTRYGALYWVATAGYRTAVYIPAPQDCGPYSGGYGGAGYGGGCGC